MRGDSLQLHEFKNFMAACQWDVISLNFERVVSCRFDAVEDDCPVVFHCHDQRLRMLSDSEVFRAYSFSRAAMGARNSVVDEKALDQHSQRYGAIRRC